MDYSSVYQTRIHEPTGDRPIGNSRGVLLGYTIEIVMSGRLLYLADEATKHMC